MTDRMTRSYQADIEVRADGDGRTVCGLCAPFDEVAEIDGRFKEVIRHGAFARTIAERGSRVKFLALHDGKSLPLGRAHLLREDRRGLYGEFRVSATARGDEVLELIRDQALDALSIGFGVMKEQYSRDHVREILEAKLYEVSAVAFGAYNSARIHAMRTEVAFPVVDHSLPLANARRRLRLLR